MPAVSALWTEARSRRLIALLQAQVDAGKRADSGFKREAWTEVTAQFNAEFEVDFTRDQLKNHFQTLKTALSIVRAMRNLSGFGWDAGQQMVVATASVWNDYLRAHPKARVYRDKPFPLFDVLDELVGNTLAQGKLRRTTKRAHDSITAEEAALDDNLGPTPQAPAGDGEVNADSDELPDVIDMYEERPRKLARVLGEGTSTGASTPSGSQSGLKRSVSMPEQKVENGEYCEEGATPARRQSTGHVPRPHRPRHNGSHALADSITAALEYQKSTSGPSEPKVFVKEKHSDMKKAIALYLEESSAHLTELHEVQIGTLLLRKEADAAYFLAVNETIRWAWMKSEIQKYLNASQT